ncbi:unnamed protein product [Linum tenue]|nr:unnamed protein product [Linum tenue]
MARGLPVEATLFWDRTILRARRPVTPEFHHVEYDPDPTMMITDNNPPKPAATVAILKITAEQLNTLKDRAMARSRYSTYEILTSHIWRCAIKARGLVNEQPTKLHISLDGRSRLSPPLPAGRSQNLYQIHQSNPIPSLKYPVNPNLIGLVRDDNFVSNPSLKYIQLIKLV